MKVIRGRPRIAYFQRSIVTRVPPDRVRLKVLVTPSDMSTSNGLMQPRDRGIEG